jgi:hypothetical protein
MLPAIDGDWTDYAIYRSVATSKRHDNPDIEALEEKHILGAPVVTATRGRAKIFENVIQR